MAATSSKKWILAILIAVVFPALAVHVSCVATIGPGTWGSGLEERLPKLLAVTPESAAAHYAAEFASPGSQGQTETHLPPELEDQLRGKIFWTDRLAPENLAVIATHEGQTWVENQHLYVWQEQEQKVRLLEMDSSRIVQQATLMKRGGDTFIVVERWLSWYVPPIEKLSRYLRSYADPTLRPEVSLFLYRLPSGPLQYWGPGHTLKPSPDRRRAILLRSGALAAGYFSMHLWDFVQDRLTTILSLREADPGSGRSFDYQWSQDSRAVHITGATAGFERRRREPRALDLIYVIEDDSVHDLKPHE
jgi:hypothetical protein